MHARTDVTVTHDTDHGVKGVDQMAPEDLRHRDPVTTPRATDDTTVVVEHEHDRDDVARDGDDRVVELEARDRFGGLSFGGSLAGMLAAIAATLVIGGIVGAAIGGIAYETGLEDANGDEFAIGSVAAGLVVLFVSFLIGGWVAGRIARYDGVRNGAMVAVWFLVLAAVLTALGAWAASEYDVLVAADLPNWFDRWFNADELTAGAVVSGVVAIVVIFAGAMLGGALGARYHRRADRFLVDRTRDRADGGYTTAPGRPIGTSRRVDDDDLDRRRV